MKKYVEAPNFIIQDFYCDVLLGSTEGDNIGQLNDDWFKGGNL